MSILVNIFIAIYLLVAAIILASTINYATIFDKLGDTLETIVIAMLWPVWFFVFIFILVKVILGKNK